MSFCCGFSRHDVASMSLGLCAFILSILYTLIGMFALVRFWMFTDVVYTIFTFTMIAVGIFVMIASIIIAFSDRKELTQTLIILFGTAVALFWNILSLHVFFNEKEYFDDLDSTKYLATNSFLFYTSLGLDKRERNQTHPFFTDLDAEHVFFNNDFYKFITLVGLIVVQIFFFMCTFIYYVNTRREFRRQLTFKNTI